MTDVRDASAPAQGNATDATGAFIWYELMTPDPEGSKTFYDAVVGWNISEGAAEYSGYRMIGRTDGGFAGGVLPLTAEMQQHGARPIWLGYLHVPLIDHAVAKIERLGGKALMPATDIPNVGRIAMVADPQGNAFYVMKPIPPQGDPSAQSDVFSLEAEQRVGWNELMTSDPAAARTFYGELFGWTSDEFMPMGENGKYRFLARQGTTFGAVCKEMGAGNSKWRFYIRVPSISAAIEAVKAGGGQISVGPHEVPGGDHIIIGNDPQGAEFALVGKK